MNKLLPCPFCGGEAIKSAFCWAGISDESTIECTMCGARTKVLKTEEAIKSWNTRKPMQEIVERLEELKNDFVNERYDKKHCEKIIHQDMCVGRNCFECVLSGAIEIVKEVGGMND